MLVWFDPSKHHVMILSLYNPDLYHKIQVKIITMSFFKFFSVLITGNTQSFPIFGSKCILKKLLCYTLAALREQSDLCCNRINVTAIKLSRRQEQRHNSLLYTGQIMLQLEEPMAFHKNCECVCH